MIQRARTGEQGDEASWLFIPCGQLLVSLSLAQLFINPFVHVGPREGRDLHPGEGRRGGGVAPAAPPTRAREPSTRGGRVACRAGGDRWIGAGRLPDAHRREHARDDRAGDRTDAFLSILNESVPKINKIINTNEIQLN